jgi:hypothetical protein
MGGLAEFPDCNALGKTLHKMIRKKIKINYGEVIIEAHADVREDLNPPLHIVEFPVEMESEVREIMDFRRLDSKELARMKDVRVKLPKRNPKVGIQMALFEDYGFYESSLLKLQDGIDSINALLIEHGLTPFAKYGHAPSKWYSGDNSETFGLILHSREIRPEGKKSHDVFDAVLAIVEKCNELKVTPKPEHKWPFSDEIKKKRLEELRAVIGQSFNPFLLSPECNDILGSMV